MLPKSYISLLLVTTIVKSCLGGTGLSCKLEWVPSGSSERIKHTVFPGVENIVARIGIDPQQPTYHGGYLSVLEGMAYAVDDQENTIESETYSVLTNPLNCTLEWIPISSDTDPIPPNAVEVDVGDSYVGRAAFDGTYKSGWTPADHGFLYAAMDGRVLKFSKYEILTSEQPSLHLSLTKFDFSPADLEAIERNTKSELFSVDDITTASSHRVNYSLIREAVIDEHFEIKEDIYGWAAVSSLDMHMIFWYGSPSLRVKDLEVNMHHAMVVGIRTERERHVKISATFEIGSSDTNIYCSYATIHEDMDIPFIARGVFGPARGQNWISQEHIKEILIQTGRDETTFSNLPDGTVQTVVEGQLNGRLFLRTSLKTHNNGPDGYGPCDRHLIP
ncbi:hypothetical protein Fcan01_27817 [Folsomia candida]|uniref:Uncharacterized protein n=2 Tax=Folsomia candida TaxID=158441 RepID=A0A226CXV6_FOLCA|nr:hypothetical protein Fcan01_27817 [Folsomia candida]